MLVKMFDPKSLDVYRDLGGLQGLAKGLRADCRSGLSRDETTLDRIADRGRPVLFPSSPQANSQPYAERKRVFGENCLPEKDVKSIFQLMWLAVNDKVLRLL